MISHSSVPVELRISELAGDRNQDSTKEVGRGIARSQDGDEIVVVLNQMTNPDNAIRRVAANVLGAIAGDAPELLTAHLDRLIEIAGASTGPAHWESLQALSAIADVDSERLAPHIEVIASFADGDSVIARDNAVKILVSLLVQSDVADVSARYLLRVLRTAPMNQFPTYAEQIAPRLDRAFRDEFRLIVVARLQEPMSPAKQRRLHAVLSNVSD